MRKSKSNRIFLLVITGALCVAGTGLTIANNWENDVQIAAVAIALSASFFAAEGTFFWAHKTWEHLNRLWRKATLAVAMGLLVIAMAGAVWSELEVALAKLSNRASSQNVAGALETLNAGKSKREQARNTRTAFTSIMESGHLNIRVWPFVACYAMAGLVSIVILAVQVGERASSQVKRASIGNHAASNPQIADRARQIGMAPASGTVKAYEDRNGGGYAIHVNGQYAGYLSKADL